MGNYFEPCSQLTDRTEIPKLYRISLIVLSRISLPLCMAGNETCLDIYRFCTDAVIHGK